MPTVPAIVPAACRAPSPLARRLVGAAVLLASVAAMLPWLAADPAISAAVIVVLALGRGPRALMRAIDDAGRVALRR